MLNQMEKKSVQIYEGFILFYSSRTRLLNKQNKFIL